MECRLLAYVVYRPAFLEVGYDRRIVLLECLKPLQYRVWIIVNSLR